MRSCQWSRPSSQRRRPPLPSRAPNSPPDSLHSDRTKQHPSLRGCGVSTDRSNFRPYRMPIGSVQYLRKSSDSNQKGPRMRHRRQELFQTFWVSAELDPGARAVSLGCVNRTVRVLRAAAAFGFAESLPDANRQCQSWPRSIQTPSARYSTASKTTSHST